MALSDILKLRAQAKAKGVAGYKNMSADELKKAIGSINGSGSKTAAKSAVKSAKSTVSKSAGAGRKTAAKTAGRKTASAKTAPAKTTAKRQSTGAGRKGAPSSTAKTTPKAHQPRKAASTGVSKDYHGGRNLIDDKGIDWTATWSVSGIRGEIFKALKKFKGDTDKTFELLAPRATEFWKKNRAGERITKENALRTLRWNISRVKFDFVMATGQHKPSKKFGTLGTGRGPAKKSAPARKPAAKPASRQKAAQGRTAASRKPAAGRKTTGRKTSGRK
jgi:hypothetical protein